MTKSIRKICCIGAGYVGGPTMAVFADKCHNLDVNVVDIDSEKIKNWNEDDLSKLPIYEPGLKEIIKRRRGINLHFSTDIKKNISSADMIFISVNTPTKKSGIGAGQASDLRWIEASSRQILEYAKGHTFVVEKSTLPVRTAETIKSILTCKKNNKKTFTILSNPEFLSEGNAIDDLNNPDRVLIGGQNEDDTKYLVEIYLNWIKREKIITTNLWSSELSKLVANAFLAQRVSSINSISALCEVTGAQIKDVSRAIGMDSRLGEKFLNAGPGFGGSCFKKDILNLVYISRHLGLYEVAEYWGKVIEINNWQQKRIFQTIVSKLFHTVSDKKIAILGFAFKANTNDTRETPALNICKWLIEEGAILNIYDPKVTSDQINNELIKVNISIRNKQKWNYKNNILDCAKETDAIIILTEWDEFRFINWSQISKVMREPSWLFDTRSISNLSKAKECGINVWTVGKNDI